MIAALQEAIAGRLTAHQRKVLIALATNGVPIDVLIPVHRGDAGLEILDAAPPIMSLWTAKQFSRLLAGLILACL